jgi:hypothetical protein
MRTSISIQQRRIIHSKEKDFFYDSKYEFESELRIRREGLFFRLWELINNENSTSLDVDPIALAPWLNSPLGKKYYLIDSKQNIEDRRENLLLVFTLDPWFAPPYILNDYLVKLKTVLETNDFNVRCLIFSKEYSVQLNQDYTHYVYQILSKHLGVVPEQIEKNYFKKVPHLKNYCFALLGTEWVCSDPLIEHILLSKGAKKISLLEKPKDLQCEERFDLSPYHEIQVVQFEHAKEARLVNPASMIAPKQWKKSVSLNDLSIPDSFLSLSYLSPEKR